MTFYGGNEKTRNSLFLTAILIIYVYYIYVVYVFQENGKEK